MLCWERRLLLLAPVVLGIELGLHTKPLAQSFLIFNFETGSLNYISQAELELVATASASRMLGLQLQVTTPGLEAVLKMSPLLTTLQSTLGVD